MGAAGVSLGATWCRWVPTQDSTGWVLSLTPPVCFPLRSLGLVLPPYSTYYIQANLSDQILQVKCK